MGPSTTERGMSAFQPNQFTQQSYTDFEAIIKRQRVSDSKCFTQENEDNIPELAFLLKRKVPEQVSLTRPVVEKTIEFLKPANHSWGSISLCSTTPPCLLTNQYNRSWLPSESTHAKYLPLHIGVFHKPKWVDEFNQTFDKVITVLLRIMTLRRYRMLDGRLV